jgi:hypothetical protein
MKICNTCKTSKEEKDFYADKRSKGGLMYSCKTCHKKRTERYRKTNPELYKIASKKWANLHPEKRREKEIKYRKNNPEYVKRSTIRLEKWKKLHPERLAKLKKEYYNNNSVKIKERAKIWYKAHPEIGRIHNAKRRAIEKAAIVYDKAVAQLIKLIYKNCPGGYHVDHIIPLTKDGLHHPDNLQYLPAIINMQKQNNLNFDCSAHAIHWQSLIEQEKIGAAT